MQLRSLFLIAFLALLLLCTGAGCKKFVAVSPPQTSISQASVYASDASAVAVLTGIYAKISNAGPSGAGNLSAISLYSGLSADELTLWNGSSNLTALAYYKNALSDVPGGYGSEFWSGIYPFIFSCNAAIEGLGSSSSLTPAVKRQLLGEAKFMRALFYFYLVNLYGQLALPLTSDYKTNAALSRSSMNQVYQQIIADLHDAQELLASVYLDGTLENFTADRTRPTTWAATALLARTYLYMGNWTGADSAASVLINNSATFALSGLDSVFLRASLKNNEAIWQLQPVTTLPPNTQDAYIFIVPSTGPGTGTNFGAYLSTNLLKSFEAGDMRATHWVGSITVGGTKYYYPYKYKVNSTSPTTPVTEHLMMLRLGEQYLIRAEARANEGNISGSQSDLDMIRSRAHLSNTNASTQEALLSAIIHERQVELFTELGHRWLDLKRTGSMDSTMNVVTPQKGGGFWNNYQQLYPVFYGDIQADPSLTQNPGYN
jgi:starch-binding outer membrane protein, SusD/RagB family